MHQLSVPSANHFDPANGTSALACSQIWQKYLNVAVFSLATISFY